jgi:hypothetical protein
MRRSTIAAVAGFAALALAGAAAAYALPQSGPNVRTITKLCHVQGKVVMCQLSHKLCHDRNGKIARCPS